MNRGRVWWARFGVPVALVAVVSFPVAAMLSLIDMCDPAMGEDCPSDSLDPPAFVVEAPVVAEAADTTIPLPPVSSTERAPGGRLDGPVASVTQSAAADRGVLVVVGPPPVPAGVFGMPFAPPGLTGCDEARFYRQQFGLPPHFDGLAWRESNCRNDVSSFCCHGIWQLYVSLHLVDHELGPRYAECGIDEIADVLGLEPIAKQRNACGAAAVFAVSGGGAWDAW